MSRYAVVLDPLQFDLGGRDFKPVPEGACLDDLLPHAIADRNSFVCGVISPDQQGGFYVLREHWGLAPRPGDIVVFHRPVLGGGEGSNPLRVILQVAAMIAISMIPGGQFAMVALRAGLTIASSLLINALIPIDQSNVPTGLGSESPTFSAGGNQARVDQPVPEFFGHMASFPDFACPPYSTYDDEGTQYYHCILLVSTGIVKVLQVYIDDTPISDFDDVIINRVGAHQSTLEGPGNGYEFFTDVPGTGPAPSITIYQHDNFAGNSIHLTANTPEFAALFFNDTASSVIVESGTWRLYKDHQYLGPYIELGPGSYPSLTADGLNDELSSAKVVMQDSRIVEDNMITAAEVSNMEMPSLVFVGPFIPIKAEFKAAKIHIDVLFPRGLSEDRSISWDVQIREVNDFGQPLGSWSTLASETFGEWSITPTRRSYSYTLAKPMRPQVRLMRTDERVEETSAAHDISWLALRAQLDTPGIIYGSAIESPSPSQATYVAIRIKASEQLSGLTQARFRVLGQRQLQVYDPEAQAWTTTYQSTRNPAWAMTYVLRKRGMPDQQIDIDQFVALAKVWDTRQDRFDMVIDDQNTMWDALTMMAKVGRAVPLIRGSKVTCWRDQQEDVPLALFSMRNICEGSFKLKFALAEAEPVDAINLDYFDSRRWDWVTVTSQYANDRIYAYRGVPERLALGLPAPSGPIQIKMPGIIGENHAKRTAAFHLADLVYRPTRANFSTELEGLLPAYGSLVTAQHDVGNFGKGGDVVYYDAQTARLIASEPLPWETGATHYIRLARPDGTLTDRIRVDPVPSSPHAMILASSPDFQVVFDRADLERTRLVFGSAEALGALAKVRQILPRSAREVEIELVLEDDRVHTADNEWLPQGTEEQDPVGTGAAVGDTGYDDHVIHLNTHYVRLGGSGLMYGKATLNILNDGRLVITVPFADDDANPHEWITPQPVTALVAGAFEVYVAIPAELQHSPTFDEFPTGLEGDASDTWLSLATSRSWTIYPGWSSYTIPVQIRRASDGALQATNTVWIYPWTPPEGG